ncbi:hypothetical protein Droror1_Dr00010685 [Drosera rotundifolia]
MLQSAPQLLDVDRGTSQQAMALLKQRHVRLIPPLHATQTKSRNDIHPNPLFFFFFSNLYPSSKRVSPISSNSMSDSSATVHTTRTPSDTDVGMAAVKEIVLWRRWKLSLAVLSAATAIWTVLKIYGYNFATIASWAGMAVVSSLFLYANALRLLNKEAPEMSGWEMTEEQARRITDAIRGAAQEWIRWMLRVSCEREWYVFAVVVAGLFLIGYAAQFLDLVTFLYTGTLLVFTVPSIYLKFEDKIKGYGEQVRLQCKRIYATIKDKLFSYATRNAGLGKDKEKKTE